MGRLTSWMGEPGGRWALPRVALAAVGAAVVGGLLGYGFDRVAGPAIGQSGWWVVAGFAAFIAGATAQAVREFARPIDPSAYDDRGDDEEAPEAA